MRKEACDRHQLSPRQFSRGSHARCIDVCSDESLSHCVKRNVICSSTGKVSELRRTLVGCNVPSWAGMKSTRVGEAGLSAVCFSGFPTRRATGKCASRGEGSATAPQASAKLSLVHDSCKKLISSISA